MDFLQCCKFAEGDSRILMLKMARDRLRAFQKNGPSGDEDEDALCSDIVMKVEQHVKSNGGDKQAAFDLEWENFYKLASLIMARISRAYLNDDGFKK
jgi:hypothetical protein